MMEESARWFEKLPHTVEHVLCWGCRSWLPPFNRKRVVVQFREKDCPNWRHHNNFQYSCPARHVFYVDRYHLWREGKDEERLGCQHENVKLRLWDENLEDSAYATSTLVCVECWNLAPPAHLRGSK